MSEQPTQPDEAAEDEAAQPDEADGEDTEATEA